MRIYGKLVWAIARRFTRCTSDAEDATQEIFLSLWQSAASFDPALGSEVTFVATVARRRLVDWMRRQSSRKSAAHVSLDGFDLDYGVETRPSDHVSSDAEAAFKALRALRPEYRRVLEMAFSEGLTQSEISAKALMPLGTVKSYMRRGLLQIRAALEGAVVDAAPPHRPAPTKRPFVVNLIPLEEPPLAFSDPAVSCG